MGLGLRGKEGGRGRGGGRGDGEGGGVGGYHVSSFLSSIYNAIAHANNMDYLHLSPPPSSASFCLLLLIWPTHAVLVCRNHVRARRRWWGLSE